MGFEGGVLPYYFHYTYTLHTTIPHYPYHTHSEYPYFF